MWFLIPLALSFITWITYRAFLVLGRRKLRRAKRLAHERVHLAVFLGSGGHTTEILALVSSLNFNRYTPRTYIISQGDTLSMKKAEVLEFNMQSKDYSFLIVPRARHVHQPIYTTPPTASYSLLKALYYVVLRPALKWRPFADVLILNGPGTCFVLCIATFTGRIIGIPTPKLIYIESFARVKSLSLSGKLLRPIVDKFLVQWPDLLSSNGSGECRGWLI